MAIILLVMGASVSDQSNLGSCGSHYLPNMEATSVSNKCSPRGSVRSLFPTTRGVKQYCSIKPHGGSCGSHLMRQALMRRNLNAGK